MRHTDVANCARNFSRGLESNIEYLDLAFDLSAKYPAEIVHMLHDDYNIQAGLLLNYFQDFLIVSCCRGLSIFKKRE